MPRALIFGAGAVGGVYSYILQKGGADVTAVCRSNYTIVKEEGFRIESKLWGIVHGKPEVVPDIKNTTGSFDFILLCSKATVNINHSTTADLIRPAVGPNTAIVIAQNGIGIEDEYANAFPNNTIISGVVYLPVTQTKPGNIMMDLLPLENIEIGTYPASAEPEHKKRVEDFKQIFTNAGATATIYDDIQYQRWIKIMVNATWSSVTALTRLNDADVIRSSPTAEENIILIMREIVAVAKTQGYEIAEKDIQQQIKRAQERLRTNTGRELSMLTDVRFNRALEVETILGNTARIAKAVRMPTPRLDTLYLLTKGLDYSIRHGKERAK